MNLIESWKNTYGAMMAVAESMSNDNYIVCFHPDYTNIRYSVWLKGNLDNDKTWEEITDRGITLSYSPLIDVDTAWVILGSLVLKLNPTEANLRLAEGFGVKL